MNRTSNRTVGVVQVTVGLCWLAVMPVFLSFMGFMEASDTPRPDSAAWRLWRALEVLLVEPRWLGTMLSIFVWGASLLGSVLVGAGIGMLGGKVQTQKWAIRTALSGIILCGMGFLFHWVLLMPVVNASQNPVVLGASADLNRASLLALGAGLVSMIVASIVLLIGSWARS